VSRRRSSRIQSRQCSVSIPHALGSFHERQSALDKRLTDPQTSQSIGATSHSGAPNSGPVEVLAPIPSKVQFQGWLLHFFRQQNTNTYLEHPPQTHNHQTKKRGPDRAIENGAERPLKRARLTEKNLKLLEKMGGR
jgi:hypothetical protein